MKALFAAGVEPALDPIGLAQVFRFWVTLPPRTAFAGIQQLAPGCSMSVRDGRVTTRQYWDMDFGGVDESRSAGDYAHELLDLLLDATRLRLRADVPVAAYLSGGLDSSAVTWMAKTVSHAAIDTFSVAFDDAEYDERVFQEDAAHSLGTRHHVVRCGVRQIADTFSGVVWHAETPVLRTAPAPMLALSGAVRDAGYKVVLSGEGADEMLGGYDIFKEAKVRAYCASQPASRRRPQLFRRLYPYLPGVQRQPAQLLERFLHTSAGDIEHPFFSHLPRWNMTSRLQLLFSDDTLKHIRGYDPYEDVRQCLPEAFGSWDPLARAQYLEAKLLLPGYILSSQGDRMAMGHSVETRMPFLDYRVVELATRMPARFKMKALTEKYLLKQCMRGHLPASIVARPKQPYRAPGGCGFFSAVQHVSAALSGGAVSESGVFNPRAVAALTAKFHGDRAIGARDDMALAGVLSTQLLMQQFVRDFPKQAKRHRNAHRATAA